MKNYYRILQVDSSAEKEIVEAAYRRLIKKYHPDVAAKKEAGIVDNDEKVRDIIEAYEILSDDDKRRSYDRTFRNYVAATKQKELDDIDLNLLHRVILMKCSVSSRTYKMHLVKYPNATSPYIVRAFELVDGDAVAFTEGHKTRNLYDVLSGIRDFEKSMKAIVKKEEITKEEIHLGDIDWTGIKCPDCDKSVEVKPGQYSSFSLCEKCHRMKCIGNAIRGVAGYYTQCPWCGKNSLIGRVVKTGSRGGSKIAGVIDDEKNLSIPRITETRLLEKKKPPHTGST